MDQLIIDAITVLLLLSLLPTVAIAFAGGVIAALQAAFQIQESSIPHLVKVLVISGAIWLLADQAYARIENLFEFSFEVSASIRQPLEDVPK